ncbi:MAG: NAD-dependent DNA ligase LigA [Defluviitaleaceae bacterium]|nr:NAD-dependent DNA ligase LigA [Defluviitaleaceae bacterium]
MNKTEAIARMKALAHQLREASKAYYQEDREIMSNFEYDRLYEELEALETFTGVQLAGSPIAQIGYGAVEGLEKVSHEVLLLSLDKTKSVDKLVGFLGEHKGLLSWKLDGLTVVLTYENGELVRAVTRGNGIVGEDVTHNARTFSNIPLRIPYNDRLLIRGEAVITYDDFEAINASISDPDDRYKNPRNLCSGTVRQLDSWTVANRSVKYFAFAILLQGGNPPVEGLKSDQLDFLNDMGFEVVERRVVDASSVEEAVGGFRQKLPAFSAPSDGLVLAYDDIAYSVLLGATSKFPRDSIAFKWADELVETTLRHIEWHTSRTGLINPIAVFDPVEIEGTTVNKAGLHNVSILRQLALGIGDQITVYKANMIIPQVAENLTRSDTAPFPEYCPVCQSPTEVLKQREGEALYCLNPNCRAQLIGSLAHFCGRDAMNIEGLSEQTLEKWVEKGFVSDYTDIFDLQRYEAEITQMEGFGQKSFDNLMTSIEKAKDVQLANFIFALGIKHVGLSNAKLLCNHFGDIETIIEKTQAEDDEEMLSVKGFGEAIVQSLRVYFSDADNVERVRKAMGLLRVRSVEKAEETEAAGGLKGLTFVITGSVNHFPNRKALQAFIEERGGKCTGSVSASTSYLINNDAESSSSKNKKAQSLGVPILTEKMFLEIVST